MSTWNTSNYRERKAARQATRPAQWFTNPETQEQFFIRPIGAAAMALAGYLPNVLKAEALDGWKQYGVEPEEIDETTVQTLSSQSLEELNRSNRTSAKVIYEACLIPTLIAIGEDPKDIQKRALANCELAWANEESWKEASDEEKLQRASEVVLPLEELDESDVKFILRRASGHADTVPMRGGRVMNMADLKSVPKKAGRRPRTGTGG